MDLSKTYSIGEVSDIAGTSARTLRFYEETGLLVPTRSANGYRRYTPADLDRLQEILLLRHMGMSVADIPHALSATQQERQQALTRHLKTLKAERNRLDALIRTVESTIGHIEKGVPMDDKAKFEGMKRELVEQNEREHGAEVRDRWGDAAADEANRKMLNLSESRVRALPRAGSRHQRGTRGGGGFRRRPLGRRRRACLSPAQGMAGVHLELLYARGAQGSRGDVCGGRALHRLLRRQRRRLRRLAARRDQGARALTGPGKSMPQLQAPRGGAGFRRYAMCAYPPVVLSSGVDGRSVDRYGARLRDRRRCHMAVDCRARSVFVGFSWASMRWVRRKSSRSVRLALTAQSAHELSLASRWPSVHAIVIGIDVYVLYAGGSVAGRRRRRLVSASASVSDALLRWALVRALSRHYRSAVLQGTSLRPAHPSPSPIIAGSESHRET